MAITVDSAVSADVVSAISKESGAALVRAVGLVS
jgi:hypothetical protein